MKAKFITGLLVLLFASLFVPMSGQLQQIAGWTTLAAYLVGFIYVWRRAAWVMAREWAFDNHIEPGDACAGITIGFLIAILWPVAAPGYLIYNSKRTFGIQSFLLPPREVREEQRKAQIDKRLAAENAKQSGMVNPYA